MTKHRYSAFIGTDLDMLLRARGINSLLVTGVGTGMCVFHTLTVGSCWITISPWWKTAARPLTDRTLTTKQLHWLREHYGLVASAGEISEIWSRKSLSNNLRT